MTSMAEHLQQARQNLAQPEQPPEPLDVAGLTKNLHDFSENLREILTPLVAEINAARGPDGSALRLIATPHHVVENGNRVGTFHDYWIAPPAGLAGSFRPRLLAQAHANRVYFAAARPSVFSGCKYELLSQASLEPEERETFKSRLAEAIVRLRL